MKALYKPTYIALICIVFIKTINAQHDLNLEDFTSLLSKGIPEGFTLSESGTDNENMFAVFMKSPQEVITVNLQKDYNINFPEQESQVVKDHKTIFYYAGFEKSAGLVVFLDNEAGYLVFGYNKPYTGDEIVNKDELIEIVKSIDLVNFE